MNFSTLSSIIQLASGILALVSGIWFLLFGTKSVHDLMQNRRRGVPYKINRLVILNMALTILVLILSSLLFFRPDNKLLSPNLQPYPPSGWKLAFSDSLRNNSGQSWAETTTPTDPGSCSFANDVYRVSRSSGNGGFDCYNSPQTKFSDLAFEVQMTITKGDTGGMLFRTNVDAGNYYKFWISSAGGAYGLEKWENNRFVQSIGSGDNSQAIDEGLNRGNWLAVVARGNDFNLYINSQFIGTVTDKDNAYTSGAIGLDAYSINNPTEVYFSDLRVWVPPP